ncbi:hypothetical protein [Sporosarcina sp. FSL K6-3457]|uniref:hypothetical protein n=1 Tax=Sporosarcina sp. FSL K6-3457 TaxID=2978204 RepID=UPI0030FCB9C9
MKNNIKGLSDSKRAEIAALAEQIYQIGFKDGQASAGKVTADVIEKQLLESEIVARLVDVTALRETVEILSAAGMRKGPFVLREMLPNGDIKETPISHEGFLSTQISWATETILEMLDDYFDENGQLLVAPKQE